MLTHSHRLEQFASVILIVLRRFTNFKVWCVIYIKSSISRLILQEFDGRVFERHFLDESFNFKFMNNLSRNFA